ncbi:MAG: hypothetical protein NTV78_01385 [Caldiserica bacterium]|nr:hypothetical protein [Caldisericota bacterium]
MGEIEKIMKENRLLSSLDIKKILDIEKDNTLYKLKLIKSSL